MIHEGEASLQASSTTSAVSINYVRGVADVDCFSTISATSINYVRGFSILQASSTTSAASINYVRGVAGVDCFSTITAFGGRSWSEAADGGSLASSPDVVTTITFRAVGQTNDSTSVAATAKVLHAAHGSVTSRTSIIAVARVIHAGISVMSVKSTMVADAINYVPGISAMGSVQGPLVILTSRGNVLNHPTPIGGAVVDAPLHGCPYETFSSFGRFDPIDFGF